MSNSAELCEEFNTKVLLNIYFRNCLPPSYRENGRFYHRPPFCFFMQKYLLKEVMDFSWRDQDCALIAAELGEEFNTKVPFKHLFQNSSPPLSLKTSDFKTHGHLFLDKKKKHLKRKVIKSFILQLCAIFLS